MADDDLFQVTTRLRMVQKPKHGPSSITAMRRKAAVEWDSGEVDRAMPDTSSYIVPRAQRDSRFAAPGAGGLTIARAGQFTAWDDFEDDPWQPLGM